MTAEEILSELSGLGSESYRKTMFRHGARDPYYGVKVEDLKKIVRRVGTDHQLALDLYASGVGDAMYLAGLIADDARMTEADLQRWVSQAYFPLLSESTVPWVAAGGPHGAGLAREWIGSAWEGTASAGWCTLSSLLAMRPDEALDLAWLGELVDSVPGRLEHVPNRVRYVMNGFVIAAGSFVPALTSRALAAASHMGEVTVDMGDTACQVPSAAAAIEKVRQRGTLGKKKKSVKC